MPAFSLCSRSPDGAATTVVTTYSCSLLLIYRPRQDERLSWPSWLTYYNSGQFTHISGHPSTVGRAQDSESSPVKDQRSTAEPWNQLHNTGAEVYDMLKFDTVCEFPWHE